MLTKTIKFKGSKCYPKVDYRKVTTFRLFGIIPIFIIREFLYTQ